MLNLKMKNSLKNGEEFDDNSDDLLPRYQHPRDGLRRVRTELYALMHFL